MSTRWDPQQYAKFADHRARPFHDLLGRVGAEDPALVVDLGCGNGPLTLGLAERWPGARIGRCDPCRVRAGTACRSLTVAERPPALSR